jgi:hypothetical protein
MKEVIKVIKVIKKNLSFKELPKDIKEAIIDNEANAMVINFDEGVYTKRTALIDAKKHYENCDDKKYVLYHSNIHGICSNEQDVFNNIEEGYNAN